MPRTPRSLPPPSRPAIRTAKRSPRSVRGAGDLLFRPVTRGSAAARPPGTRLPSPRRGGHAQPSPGCGEKKGRDTLPQPRTAHTHAGRALTLVFGVDFPHQGDISLQIEGQRLDGVQIILHVVHEVQLLSVCRTQHFHPAKRREGKKKKKKGGGGGGRKKTLLLLLLPHASLRRCPCPVPPAATWEPAARHSRARSPRRPLQPEQLTEWLSRWGTHGGGGRNNQRDLCVRREGGGGGGEEGGGSGQPLRNTPPAECAPPGAVRAGPARPPAPPPERSLPAAARRARSNVEEPNPSFKHLGNTQPRHARRMRGPPRAVYTHGRTDTRTRAHTARARSPPPPPEPRRGPAPPRAPRPSSSSAPYSRLGGGRRRGRGEREAEAPEKSCPEESGPAGALRGRGAGGERGALGHGQRGRAEERLRRLAAGAPRTTRRRRPAPGAGPGPAEGSAASRLSAGGRIDHPRGRAGQSPAPSWPAPRRLGQSAPSGREGAAVTTPPGIPEGREHAPRGVEERRGEEKGGGRLRVRDARRASRKWIRVLAGQGRTMFPGRLSGVSVSEGQRFSAPPWERGAGVQLPRPARCAALTG